VLAARVAVEQVSKLSATLGGGSSHRGQGN
jgi:hypothetical protein